MEKEWGRLRRVCIDSDLRGMKSVRTLSIVSSRAEIRWGHLMSNNRRAAGAEDPIERRGTAIGC